MITFQQTMDMVNTIKYIYHEKGYEFFERGDDDINLIGIRHSLDIPNKYTDTGLMVWRNVYKEWQMFQFEMTTTPGEYYRLNPINELGTGIIVEGQHKNLFIKGKHRRLNALVQYSDVPVYRDNNKDLAIDKEKIMIAPATSGFNFHGITNENLEFPTEIGKFSAGCQVVPDRAKYNLIISLCYRGMKKYGGVMTYTILDEVDFRGI